MGKKHNLKKARQENADPLPATSSDIKTKKTSRMKKVALSLGTGLVLMLTFFGAINPLPAKASINFSVEGIPVIRYFGAKKIPFWGTPTNKAYFEYSCKYFNTELPPESETPSSEHYPIPALVVGVQKDPLGDVVVLRVASADGGFLVTSALATEESMKVPTTEEEKLRLGDLVAWKPISYSKKFSSVLQKISSRGQVDHRSGWLGEVIAKVRPCMYTEEVVRDFDLEDRRKEWVIFEYTFKF